MTASLAGLVRTVFEATAATTTSMAMLAVTCYGEARDVMSSMAKRTVTI